MHKLDRQSVPKPAILEVRAAAGDGYDGMPKEEVRSALIAMQHGRCAYCERRTGSDRNDGHIEHFMRKVDALDRQLNWDNLYWSCNDPRTCGRHKDACKERGGRDPRRCFTYEDLIAPCVDDPETFLVFVEDGSVMPRPDLSAGDRRRAEETIRVFNLAHLRYARESALGGHVRAIRYLQKHNVAAIRGYIEEVLGDLDGEYPTCVRHYLQSKLF